MKKRYINIGLLIGLFAMLSFTACKEDIDPVVEELSFDRAFTPLGLAAEISTVTTVKIKWNTAKNVDHYVVEIYEGTDFAPASLIYTTDLDIAEETEMSLLYVLPAGDTQFSARVKAVSSLEGVDDSKWSAVEFKSGPENLFTGYESFMSGLNECTVKWKPGSTATALLFVKGTTETSYPVTADELAAGVKVLTGVPTGNYTVKLMNTTFSRGSVKLLIEGDVMLSAGADLYAAITAANTGDVILLPQGEVFIVTSNQFINKSIKIRAIYEENLPTIAAATGASTTAPLFLIDPALTSTDSIVFQNVAITGYINNDSSLGTTNMITGVYDQGTSNACNVGLLKFDGCVLSHFSRQLIRLRGTATQVIDKFVVNDCILFDYGTNSTSYGIISSNNATATINNIVFSNSTIYNFLSYLILYQNGTACNSISIDNCSLNQITYTTGSTSRFIIDLNNTTFTGSSINITDCIFGSTAAANTNGVRTTAPISVTDSYCTSDFIDNGVVANVAYSVMSKFSAYSGASTDLWTDPVAGNFTFKTPGTGGIYSAGAPRWRP